MFLRSIAVAVAVLPLLGPPLLVLPLLHAELHVSLHRILLQLLAKTNALVFD